MNDQNKIPSPIANQSGPRTVETELSETVKPSLPPDHPLFKATGGQSAQSSYPPVQPTPMRGGQMPNQTGTIILHPESVAQEIELPSRGKLYPGGLPKKVVLREMRMRDMMVMQTPALWRDNKVFQMIFEHCVQGLPPGMSVLDLFSLDREALLVALRIMSFGRKYKVRVTCPRTSCQHKFDHMLDLEADFPVKYLDKDMEYPMIIPANWLRCGRKVVMHLMTFRDELEVDRKSESAMDKGQSLINTRLQDQLEAVVEEVQDLDRVMLKPWIEGLSAHDASILDQMLSDRYFGMETEFYPPACPKCGNVFSATMPINEDFFRSNLPKTETPNAVSNR